MVEPLFDKADKEHLYKIFSPEDHEFRVLRTVGREVDHAWKKKGNVPEKVKEYAVYSIYIKRDAIINRLNDRFFGEWSSGFLDPKNPAIYHKSHVDCAMHMTLRGVRMEYNGSQSGTGENGAKGAATDAFKRVASQWGIGLYLQHAPDIMTKNPDSLNKQGQASAKSEVENKIKQWVDSLLESKPLSVEGSESEEVTPVAEEHFTDAIRIVGIKADGNKRHIVADGCTFFSRDVFRALDYDDEIIEELAKVGMRHLSDPIRIVYTEVSKDGNTFRKPLRVQRTETRKVVNLSELKKASA